MGVVHGGTLRGLSAVVEVCAQNLELEIKHRLQQAHFYMPAVTCDGAPNEAGEKALDEMCTSEDIGNREAAGRWTLVGVTVEPHEA
jgi:hypothetical protein